MKYFTVYSKKAIENKSFAIVIANILNDSSKIQLSKKLFKEDDYYYQFHNEKIDILPVKR